jgi:hypothetical protein
MLQTLFGPTDQIRGLAVAVSAGILVSITHAIFDFPWHIPSCMSIAIILLSILCSLNMHVERDRTTVAEAGYDNPRFPSGSIPAAVLGGFLLLFIAIHSYVGPARARG